MSVPITRCTGICFLLLGLTPAGLSAAQNDAVAVEGVTTAMEVGHRVQVWELLPPMQGAATYTVEMQHAAAGPSGAFAIVAWADKDDDGRPDTEITRSELLTGKKGEWSAFTFDTAAPRVFVGNTWADPATVIYYAMSDVPEGIKGLGTTLYYSRREGGVPRSTAQPRMTNIRVRGEGKLAQPEPANNTSPSPRADKPQAGEVTMDGRALFRMGMKEWEKPPEKRDREALVNFWTMAASQGHGEAAFNLGQLYARGDIGQPDFEEAARWWAEGARAGNPQSMYNLAKLMEEGRGVEKDPAEAVKLLRQASDAHFPPAMYSYAVRLEEGAPGLLSDEKAAIELLKKAGNAGNAQAQSRLGFKYLQGIGVQRNDATGLAWTEMAAHQGDPDALNNLATIYFQGSDAVAPNLMLAVQWYEKAAKAGHPEAQNFLGKLYFLGQGVRKDTVRAQELWLASAKQGLASAQFNIGNYRFHFPDSDAILDQEQSLEWLRKAAEQGHGGALRALQAQPGR